MGCVQSLFNPSKSGSGSPEREFVPPTFETVVVTRQPKKSSKNAAGGGATSDGDDEAASGCDDFEKCAAEDGDNRSLHFVEATAVRTLAANTGSVAILGTTAKCKSLGDSPPSGDHQWPAIERQRSWPLSDVAAAEAPKQQLVVETRFVEATAVRTLAAETGSIAILGTTADPKPARDAPADDAETGSVHCVEATAVRHLAAETGTIAILASTATAAVVASQRPVAAGQDDELLDLMPVGVREVLDSEPTSVMPDELWTEKEREEREREQDDSHPLIPLPVVRAMETKPEFAAAMSFQSPSLSGKTGLPPRSMTADGDAGSGAGSAFEACSRKPLVRQSNKTRERDDEDDENDDEDDCAPSDVWTPTIPVFAKCPPAKSKSLPNKNSNSESELKSDEGQHGVVRGSSLPSDHERHGKDGQHQSSMDSGERIHREQAIEPVVVKQNETEPKLIEPKLTEHTVDEPKPTEHTVVEQKSIEHSVVEPKSTEHIVVEQKSTEHIVDEPKPIKHTVVGQKSIEHIVVEQKPTQHIVDEPKPTEHIVVEQKSTENIVVEPKPTEHTVVEQKSTEHVVVKQRSNEHPVLEQKSIEHTVVEPKSTEHTVLEQNSIEHNAIQSKASSGNDEKTPVELNGTNRDFETGRVAKQNGVLFEPKRAGSKEAESGRDQEKKSYDGNASVDETDGKIREAVRSDDADGTEIMRPFDSERAESGRDQEVIPIDGNADGKIREDREQSAADAEAEEEYRLTMIQSVREAVNRICEQAVEKTAEIVKSGRGRASAVATQTSLCGKRDADDSEISEFSLPPPPPVPGADLASTGQESSWPPPPQQDAEEERTIAPGISFDLPDPPTDMDQMDSETDKLDISDEEMRATGLPSDEDDKTDTETGEDHSRDDRTTMSATIANGTPAAADDVAANASVAEDEPSKTSSAASKSAGDRAATTIQAVYRGFRARKHVETVHAAAAKIQAGFRGYRVRRSLKTAGAASTATTATTTTDDSQCWSDDDQKSVVSVVSVAATADGDAFADEGDGQTAAAVEDKAQAEATLTEAAVKIQARVRGFAARKRLNEEKNGKR